MRMMHTTFSVFALGVILGVAELSWGQNALGDGRALDANLQITGGGRTNNPVARNNYGNAANAIATGNVSGLSGFRGDLGYRPGNEFRGRTGSGDLFNILRRSINSNTGVTNLGYGSGWSPGNIGNRYAGINASNPYSSGAVRPVRNATTSLGDITGQYQPYNTGSPQWNTGTSTLQVAAQAAQRDAAARMMPTLMPQTLGAGVSVDGSVRQVTASPLTGLSVQSLTPRQRAANVDRASEYTTSDNDDRLTNPQFVDALVTPSLALGERLSASRTNMRDTRLTARPTDRAAVISKNVFRPLGSSTAQPGEDIFLDLLRQIRDDQAKVVSTQPENRLAAQPAKADQPATDKFDNQVEKTVTYYATKRKEAEEAAAAAKEEADADNDGEESDVRSPGATTDEHDRLLKMLDYDLPPMITLAGASDDALSKTMNRAEQMMQQKNYFDAEHAYVSALLVKPGYPLAMIGKANAQLGAGLFLSAGRSLREVFMQHPELISARYAPPVLPDETRSAYLERSLRRMMEAHNPPELPLVLAYFGHQQGRPEAIREGLDAMANHAPNDKLIPLLRRLWLNTPSP